MRYNLYLIVVTYNNGKEKIKRKEKMVDSL